MPKQQDKIVSPNHSDFVRIVVFNCGDYSFGLDSDFVVGVEPGQTTDTLCLAATTIINKHTLLIKGDDFEYKVGISNMPSLLDVSVTNIYPLPYLLAQKNSINGLNGIVIDKNKGSIFLIDPYKFNN